MKSTGLPSAAFTLALSGLIVPAALAHVGAASPHQGSHGGGQQDNTTTKYPDTYFALPDHAGLMYAHIAVMVLAWVMMLPPAVVLSLARSRYTLTAQSVFLSTNAVGVVLAIVYNTHTPELYPHNAHHKIGWIITVVGAVEFLVGLVGRVASASLSQAKVRRDSQGYDLTSVAKYDSIEHGPYSSEDRIFYDGALSSGSNIKFMQSCSGGEARLSMSSSRKEFDERGDDPEDMLVPVSTPKFRLTSKAGPFWLLSLRARKPLAIGRQIIGRMVLPFGFIALTTGVATYGGLFAGESFLNGLAHWIKGSVFIWLGLLTLSRWSGTFASIGWAWNARRRRNQTSRAWTPSCEFVESALICFYGCTNIFLEHVSGWGGEWTSRDLEHVAITVLFIGGGALGMLVESRVVRDLLNTAAREEETKSLSSDEESGQRHKQVTYEVSLNPIPALVILLLGMIMSSHEQSSTVSSMVHKQWGNLLSAASLSRTTTYVIMYLKPPASVFPSRPPTELLASFGLISGGVIFMASSEDTVAGMIHHDLNATFVYTTTMGLVGLLMAWEVALLALKGWAERKERRVGA